MRVSIIGAGDKKFHYQEMLGLSEEEFSRQVEGIAKILVELGCEVVTTPDKGIYFDIAEAYKRFGGKKVFGTVPVSDKTYGIKHLMDFINEEVDGKKVVDELIDTFDWYQQDVLRCVFGDMILYLGTSLGSIGELAFGYYVYKIAGGGKPEVRVPIERVHPKAIAGKNFPLITIAYKPFLKDKLPAELEEYIARAGGKLVYVYSLSELKKALSSLPKEYAFKDVKE